MSIESPRKSDNELTAQEWRDLHRDDLGTAKALWTEDQQRQLNNPPKPVQPLADREAVVTYFTAMHDIFVRKHGPSHPSTIEAAETAAYATAGLIELSLAEILKPAPSTDQRSHAPLAELQALTDRRGAGVSSLSFALNELLDTGDMAAHPDGIPPQSVDFLPQQVAPQTSITA